MSHRITLVNGGLVPRGPDGIYTKTRVNPTRDGLGNPVAPTNVTVLFNLATPTTVTITWTNACPNCDGVQIERQVGVDVGSVIATLPATATSYVDTGASDINEFTNYYKVRSIENNVLSVP